MKDKKARFIKMYSNMPLALRNTEIICVLDGKEPLTANACWIEVNNNTKVSKDILDYLDRLEII